VEGPKIHRIVLTGGPCAGKTTALAKMTERLESCGFRVFRVPEMATLFFMAGATPQNVDPLYFQQALMRMQMRLEDGIHGLAQAEKTNAVVLCDRGTMDSAAYVWADQWTALLDEQNWNPVLLRDSRYDAVLFLSSAAGKPETSEFYITSNNAARKEGVEQAAALDKRTLDAWMGHPHVRIVGSYPSFEEKIRRAVATLCRTVGIPEPLEIERKYLVKSIGRLPESAQMVEIEQVYLDGESGERIRRRTQHNNSIYIHTIKRRISATTRHEVERQIAPREYIALKGRADPLRQTIRKQRTCFVHEGLYFELDVFETPHIGLKLLEIELEHENDKVPLPPFIEIDREVTEDPLYTNRQLALGVAR